MLDHGLVLGGARDEEGAAVGDTEGVVVDVHPAPRDVGAVLAVAAPVHVEAVAEAASHLDVVTRLVPRAAAAGAGDGVAVGVEKVALDQGLRLVEADAVPEPLVLVVVDEAVLHAVAVPGQYVHGPEAPAGELAVVDPQPRVPRLDAGGGGELVVVAGAAAFVIGAGVVLQALAGVRPLQAEAGEARVRPRDPDQRIGGEGVGADQPAGGPADAAVAGQGHAAGQLQDQLLHVDPLGALDDGVCRHVHGVAGAGRGQGLQQLVEVARRRASGPHDLAVPGAAAEGVAAGPGGAAERVAAGPGGAAGAGTAADAGRSVEGGTGVEHGGEG